MDNTKICPACGGTLECKLRNFSIGADGGGGLLTLLADTYDVDLYACQACGKVELYTAGVSLESEEMQEESDVVCPVCGTRHSPLIGCPTCALRGAHTPPRSPSAPPAKKKERRPPWEK